MGFGCGAPGFPVVNRFAPFLTGSTISGMTGLAFDPCGFQSYIILKVNGVSGRVLATINLTTMECTQVGNLGDNFSSICFDRNGQLFGLTGDGATVSEALYSINKLDASKILLRTLGNGADGEVLSYDPTTDIFYHWSGNSSVVYEKFANVAPYTTIPIFTGSVNGEIFGALYLGPNQFLVSNISSSFNFVDTIGVFSPPFGSNPDDLRGLIMPPVFAANTDTVCAGVGSVSIASAAADLYTVIYHWGDGTIDTLLSGTATHTYSAPGNYSVVVELSNGYCNPDTFWTTSVAVNNIPLVSLTGSSVLCPGGSVLLTGSGGGTSQWYLNGSAIPGETSPSYTATTAGWYNMVKTNLNGCGDSAAIGIDIINGSNPVVNLGNDTTVCGQLLLDAQNTGNTFLWNTSDTTQTLLISASNLYSVTVTDSNGCSATDDINLVVNALPIVALSGVNTICDGDSSLLSGTSGGTSQWYLDGIVIAGATSDSYYASQPGVYNMIKTNANGCSDSSSVGIQFIVNALPLVSLAGTNSVCDGDSSLLSGTSGGTSQWYLDGIVIAGATSDSYYASQPGVYNMIKTNANGCSDSSSVGIQFIVNALPLVSLAGTNSVCDGDSSLLSGTSGGTSQWYLDGVVIAGATSDSYYASQPGVYNMIKTNANGCSDSSSVGIQFIVNALPLVSLAGTNSICDGDSSLLSGTSGGTSQWYLDGVVIAGATSDSYYASQPGVYNMIKTNANGCSDSAAVGISLTVSSLPVVTYTELNDTVCSQQGVIALTAGNPTGGVYSGLFVTGTSFDAGQAGPGSYVVNYFYTDINGCSSGDSSEIIVLNCVGINENENLANSILISPNPVSDVISLSFETQSNIGNSLQIINSLGELVDQKEVYLGKITLDVSKLQSGLYYIHVRSGNYFASKKVIIIH
ncbi:MAG: T9SS type A sorting domain-containing protein [Bacteroidetes bacterium]|nr:T9SS type A sorting domain-containing protein [Bacteroidota bacterium]